MAGTEARLDRMDEPIQALAGAVGEMAREIRGLVQRLAADRASFRETLREMSGFVATAGLEVGRLGGQIDRLAEITEAGFTQMQVALAENNRLITENNAAIRRLLDILARGRGDGERPPP